jgi:hypothetical protein
MPLPWLSLLHRKSGPARRPPRARHRFRPALEQLEARLTPSTLVPVTTPEDLVFGATLPSGNTATLHHLTAPATIVPANAVVSDPPVVGQGNFAVTGAEGSSTGTVTVATFTDPGGAEDPTVAGNYGATINWGDNTTSTGAIALTSGTLGSKTAVYTVTGGHTYTEEGPYTITVTLHHAQATPDQTVTDTATISDPPLVSTGVSLTANQGVAFTGQAVATFTDPGTPGGEPLSVYGANINWGDGTAVSPGTITGPSSGVFKVTGGHTYAAAGTYAVQVTLAHDTAPSTFVSSTLVVSATHLAVTTQPPASVPAGSSFGLAVSAEDPNGNLLTGFSGSVTLALASNPGGSTLGGTLTVNAVDGVATFSGLTLDRTGNGYALLATAAGLTPATIGPFSVTGLALSATSVYEFRPAGTAVGALTTGAPGSGHTFTYALVAGTGSADDASFTVQGDQLLSADAFDFAARSSYSIRVRSTDEAGQTFEQAFTIRVLDDPALTRSGSTLTVTGTAGNDIFAFTPGAVRDSLALNGTALAVDTASVDTVVFQGNGGSDSAILAALPGGGNTLLLSPGGSSLSGPGYAVRLQGVAAVWATGGSGDSASLSDPTASDDFVAKPALAYLTGSGFYGQANGFATVVGVSGGTAYLYDSAGNDVFVGTPTYAYLTGPGSFNEAAGFKTVLAYSTAGGSDTAELADAGPGGSAFVATPTYAYLDGGGSRQEANGFRTVIGVAAAGDTATLYDSAGNDSFVALPGVAYLAGSGFMNQADGFKTVVAVSQGGQDTATLYGAASGSSALVATPSYAYFSGPGFFSQASGFKTVAAVSQGGNDAAYLYGSGGNDTLVATAAYADLSGGSFYTQASGFRSVYAYGAGGSDRAYLYGTGTSADVFQQGGGYAYLYGNAFLDMANAFGYVYANPKARR